MYSFLKHFRYIVPADYLRLLPDFSRIPLDRPVAPSDVLNIIFSAPETPLTESPLQQEGTTSPIIRDMAEESRRALSFLNFLTDISNDPIFGIIEQLPRLDLNSFNFKQRVETISNELKDNPKGKKKELNLFQPFGGLEGIENLDYLKDLSSLKDVEIDQTSTAILNSKQTYEIERRVLEMDQDRGEGSSNLNNSNIQPEPEANTLSREALTEQEVNTSSINNQTEQEGNISNLDSESNPEVNFLDPGGKGKGKARY